MAKGDKLKDFLAEINVTDWRDETKDKEKTWTVHSPSHLWRKIRRYWQSVNGCGVRMRIQVDITLGVTKNTKDRYNA